MFAAHVANPANVKAIKGGDPQFYYLRVTPRLRLVYQKDKKGIRVVDLVDQATVARFSADEPKANKNKKPTGVGLRAQTPLPKTSKSKVGELIEK